jgi:hypothetical protein
LKLVLYCLFKLQFLIKQMKKKNHLCYCRIVTLFCTLLLHFGLTSFSVKEILLYSNSFDAFSHAQYEANFCLGWCFAQGEYHRQEKSFKTNASVSFNFNWLISWNLRKKNRNTLFCKVELENHHRSWNERNPLSPKNVFLFVSSKIS